MVIFEEMGQMHLETVDPDDPFPGLARRLTDHALWGTSARRARLNVALAKQLKVDGAVHFNHWGCRHGLGSVPVVRAAFMEAGIPFLAIDGDALARGGPSRRSRCRRWRASWSCCSTPSGLFGGSDSCSLLQPSNPIPMMW